MKALAALTQRFDGLAGGLGAIQRSWPTVVGEQASRFTMPVRLEEGELRVRCSSATWASELLGMSSLVLQRLHEHVGDLAPSRLRPYTGRLPAFEVAPEQPVRRPTAVDPGDVDQARRELGSKVAGPLADSIARAMAASRSRRGS